MKKKNSRYDENRRADVPTTTTIVNLRVYLLGKEVVVHSDHKPLQYLHAHTKLQQARHMKWMSYLLPFSIIKKYKKGLTNKLVDVLSRPPVSALLVAMISNQWFLQNMRWGMCQIRASRMCMSKHSEVNKESLRYEMVYCIREHCFAYQKMVTGCSGFERLILLEWLVTLGSIKHC